MENFRDVAHLQLSLQAVFTDEPGVQPGQRYLSDHLKTRRGFTGEQADLYASTVVARNTESSAGQMAINASKTDRNVVGGYELWNSRRVVLVPTANPRTADRQLRIG